MKRAGFLALLMVVYASTALGETTRLGQCERTFEANLQQGMRLRIDTRSGDIDITGSSEPKIRVSCIVPDEDRYEPVTVSFASSQSSADLRVSGGPKNHFRLEIQIPDHTNLTVRTTAGDLAIKGITGDKDVSLRAGDLTIDVGDPGDYSRAEASVRAGDLKAPAFGVNKGGLFRSFKKTNLGGKYRLDAHLWAGDLTLR